MKNTLKKGQLYNMVNKSCGHLSYKIGVILIHNSKTFIGILGIPIKILVCLYHHRYRTRHLISKNYYNCHSETIEESFTYRLGKSFNKQVGIGIKVDILNFGLIYINLKKNIKIKKANNGNKI